jgi:hypothetical protein
MVGEIGLRLAAVVLHIGVALLVLGCGNPGLAADPASAVQLVHGPDWCFTSGITGTLIVDPTYGVALSTDPDPEGLTVTMPIAWQSGFVGRRVGSEVEVLSPDGTVVATTGRRYTVPGGGVNGAWLSPPIPTRVHVACGDITDLGDASP